jgi:2,4-dienoyl-CoA reductase-like NADH-dependent reductase (Old Yellow Enzyme family)/thioredoxin reductase
MKLFESFRIGSLELKNRIVMAPMSCNLGKDGFVTERMVRFFEERAKGGVGLITIGDGIVDTPLGNNVKESTAIDDDKYIPFLRKLTEAVKAHGAKICLQLSHAGRRAGRVSKEGYLDITKGRIPVAPSSIPHPVVGQVVPKELTQGEIKRIVEKFGQASRRAIEAGFDAIGLHCAHMYLCGQFLSPWANRRNDEYGHDLEGRLKFVLEVIERIKREVGKTYPLIVRMNGEEPQGGNALGEIQEIARRFEKAGVDAIHVSVGFGAPTKTPGLIPSVTPMRASAGCIVHLAENIKRGVSIPVIAVNKLGDISLAENVLQEGRADLIALGRPLIADPSLPLKAAEGRFDEIRPCIYCCKGCLQNVLEKDAPVACSVNPVAGREMEEGPILPAEKKKKVFIIGGGPAGMQAALTAAMRGHQIYLVEKAKQLGGLLLLASRPPGKGDIEPFKRYLINAIERSGVQVELGREVTPERISEIHPDIAILATGSHHILPNIPGLQNRKAFTVKEILEGSKIEGKKILIIGGGQVGCEVAEFLSEQGKEVTIVEILEDIARDMDRINRLPLIMSLENHGVRIMKETEVSSITDQGVWVNCFGERSFLPIDQIVIAVGAEPRSEEVEERMKEKVPEVYWIGDKVKARGILEAVQDGYEIAKKI